ncbi:acyl carrier protein [Streptomyces virginiae]|uniref:acyl carrier protein n=1 Tax=Streptomyces virginiae TaxID=1961 RepID=UPI0036BBA8C3
MKNCDLNIDQLRKEIASVLDIEAADVIDDADFFEDLGVDSLLALEMVVRLERTYGVEITEMDTREVTTLRNTYDLLTSKLGGR